MGKSSRAQNARLAQLRAEQAAAERRQRLMMAGGVVLVVLVIVGALVVSALQGNNCLLYTSPSPRD